MKVFEVYGYLGDSAVSSFNSVVIAKDPEEARHIIKIEYPNYDIYFVTIHELDMNTPKLVMTKHM